MSTSSRIRAVSCVGMVLAGGHLSGHAARIQDATPASPIAAPAAAAPSTRALLDKYCVTCHNERLKTASLALDRIDPERIEGAAEVWEKVARKLRTHEMPPPGRPRPDPATYAAAAAGLEASLDRASAARPNPGFVGVHRLNRTEYTNAIRDILGLTIDSRALLPEDEPDRQSFDNIASVLSVSPALLERYLTAADVVSRLAVGDTATSPVVDTYKFRQSWFKRTGRAICFRLDRVAAPRSGISSRSMASTRSRSSSNVSCTLRDRHGGASSDRPAAGRGAAPAVLRWRRGQRYSGAGNIRRQHAGRRGMGEVHAHGGRGSGGPCSRESRDAGRWRDLRQKPLGSRGHPPAAAARFCPDHERALLRRSGSGGGAHRRSVPSPPVPKTRQAGARFSSVVRRSASPKKPAPRKSSPPWRVVHTGGQPSRAISIGCCAFTRLGRAEGNFETGIRRGLERILAAPSFLFRVQHEPPDAAPGTAYRLQDLDLASRLSFFLWSSVPDESPARPG